MKATSWQARLVMAALGLVVAPGAAFGMPVSFAFEAEDASGRLLTGQFFYDTATGPSFSSTNPEFGYADFNPSARAPMGFTVELGGQQYSFQSPPLRPGLDEITLIDSVPGSSLGDVFDLRFPEGGSPPFPYFVVHLVDHDWTALGTHLALPSMLDFGQFEERRIEFYTGPGGPNYFSGTIFPSIAGSALVPEPPTLALLAPAILAGAAIGWRRRRGRP